MKIINASYEIITPLDGNQILKHLEVIARTCYKSEDKITDTSAEKMIKALINGGHTAMIEHYSFSVKFICDRGITHEIVRHRLASYAQESTRYCNYSKGKFGSELTFIKPCFFDENSREYRVWVEQMQKAEDTYLEMINSGVTPEQARDVLPTSIKTELVMTTNLTEWRHFFNLRAVGVTGKPHPQMTELAIPLLREVQEKIPVVFDDLIIKE